MNIKKGGQTIYGCDIGILILDSKFPRISGDIGNAKTWDFPVLYKIVSGAIPEKIVLNLDMSDIQMFIDAARELEQQGVKAITTSCGFLSLFQEAIASCVNIPVFTSALLLVPLVSKMIGKNNKVGVLTANSSTLTDKHLTAAGIDTKTIVIQGLENKEVFTNFTVQNWEKVDMDICRRELIDSAYQLVNQNNSIHAIVLECTNMPPFAIDIQRETGLPVFDIITLTNMVYHAINPSDLGRTRE